MSDLILVIDKTVYENWEVMDFEHTENINTTIIVRYPSGKQFTHHCEEGWVITNEPGRLVLTPKPGQTKNKDWSYVIG